eukprot:COSAG02_NODE_14207_length_1297_cov_1.231219_2_plen_144_part_01
MHRMRFCVVNSVLFDRVEATGRVNILHGFGRARKRKHQDAEFYRRLRPKRRVPHGSLHCHYCDGSPNEQRTLSEDASSPKTSFPCNTTFGACSGACIPPLSSSPRPWAKGPECSLLGAYGVSWTGVSPQCIRAVAASKELTGTC